jgi:PAS domain S-box-containing protein
MKKKTPSSPTDLKSKNSKPQFLRVLIVEDSEDDALLEIRELKKGGYNPVYERVETATAMKKALQEKQWDIILCDYKMPKFSGEKAIGLLKETNIDIPLIIVSGNIGEDVAVNCMHLGANDYIMKNNLSRLCPAIARELVEAASRSKQKQAEEALWESKEELQWLFKSMINAFVLFESVFNDDGHFISYRFVYINDAYERITGVKNEEVKGKTVHEIWPETEPEWIKRYGEVAVTGVSQTFDLYHDPTKKIYHCKVYRPWDKKDRFCVIFEDITDRKLMEETLVQEVKRLDLAQSVANAGIWDWDIATGHIEWSNQIFSLFGLDPLKATASFEAWRSILHPEDLEIASQRIEEALEQRTPLNSDYRIILPDRQIRWINAGGESEYDIHGRPVRMIGICIDITFRKQAEEKLRRSEENFRKFFDNSPLGVRIVTKEGETVYANRAIMYIYGYDSIEELRTTPVEKRYTPESHADFLIRREKRQQGVDIQSEYTIDIIRKDGEVRSLKVFRKEILWDDERQFQVIYQDITERKQAEESLRESERKFKELFERMSSGVAVYETVDGGEDFIFRNFNSAGEAIEKVNREDVIGKRVTEVFPGIKEFGLFGVLQRVWKTGESEYLPDNLYKDQHDKGTWRESWVYKLPSGEIVAIYNNITDRKRVEEELKTSQSQLRALSMRLLKIREEEAIRIAREIHDEMGGGLTGLKIDISWLLRKMDDADPGEERVALMDKIHASKSLIDQMIQVVRRISTDLRPSVLDDLGLMAALEWQLSEFTRRTEISHEFATAFEHVNMEEDTAIAVFRIFQEALTNVARHSQATKVVVDLREGERDLFGDESFVLEIRDNGRGITQEEIMNPESLGLLGMKERVMAFGGELSISGEPGGGTALTLQIPRKQGETL